MFNKKVIYKTSNIKQRLRNNIKHINMKIKISLIPAVLIVISVIGISAEIINMERNDIKMYFY
jgi:hypothetical protein